MIGNCARGVAGFLSVSQLPPWREYIFRVRETFRVILGPLIRYETLRRAGVICR